MIGSVVATVTNLRSDAGGHMHLTRTRWLTIACGVALSLGLARLVIAEDGRSGKATGESAASAESRSEGEKERPKSEREEPEPEEKEEHIETDRDSFTPSTRTVEKGRTVLEAAYSFIDNRNTADNHSFPEVVARIGITDGIELRLGWNYEVGGGGGVVSGVEGAEGLEGGGIKREARALYGMKFRLSEQEKWIPESSVIMQAFTPTLGDATATDVSVTYVFGWELPDKWKLDAALRYGTVTEVEDNSATWSPSVVLRVPLAESWYTHVEYFGISPQGSESAAPQHYLSPGLHYLVNNDLEVGFRLGWGLTDASENFFVNAGVGMRF